MNSDPGRQAFTNAMSAIRPGVKFPANVFAGPWSNFLFLESDALFFGQFVWAIKEFLRIERSTAACIVNLSRQRAGAPDEQSTLWLNSDITNDKYQEQLRAERGEIAWFYDVEDYVCASDVGSWCIYAEKQSEIAVIALKNVAASKQFHYALRYLGADSLTYLLRAHFPFTHITADWRASLVKNYKPSRGRNPH
jgi:hypothetical protein